MSVVTTKSAAITNRDASPSVLNNGAITKADLRKAIGVVSIASGDSVASKYIACSIPSNAVVSSALISSPDLGTTTAADFGLYQSTQAGGAAVSSQFFKAGVVLNAGPITKTECLLGNIITVATMEKRVWELLGLASDPGTHYDVVLTLSGAADGSGSVAVEIQYTQ